MRKVNGVLYDVSEEDLELLKADPTEFWKGVTGIGDFAFLSLNGLESIKIPEGIEWIGDQAFKNCQNLKSIKLPSTLKEIGYEVFAYSGLTNIKIPEGMVVIDGYAFFDCKNLKNIKLPSTLEYIGEVAFYRTGLVEIEIPEGVSRIREYAFSGCVNLTSVKIPDEINKIGDDAFDEKTALHYRGYIIKGAEKCSSVSALREMIKVNKDPDTSDKLDILVAYLSAIKGANIVKEEKVANEEKTESGNVKSSSKPVNKNTGKGE